MNNSIESSNPACDPRSGRSFRNFFANKEQVLSSSIALCVAVTLVAIAWFSSLDVGLNQGVGVGPALPETAVPATFSAEDPYSPVKAYVGDGSIIG